MNRDQEIFDELEELIVADAKKKFSAKVMDHFNNPRNLGEMPDADAFTLMSGICGDTIGIFVGVEGDRIARTSFVTNGCGATVACASAVTCLVEDMTVDQAMTLSGKDLIEFLDGLPLENTHCADLAVNTLKGALAKVRN